MADEAIHRTVKLKIEFAGDEVDVAADLGRQGGCQEALRHQTPLFVGRHVMHALVAREAAKCADVALGESPLPRDYIADLHRYLTTPAPAEAWHT